MIDPLQLSWECPCCRKQDKRKFIPAESHLRKKLISEQTRLTGKSLSVT